MSIHIDSVSKQFGSFAALQDVSLAIPEGQLVALLGPSGSGKTTLLRIIAGLEAPDAGGVRIHGDAKPSIHARRKVGFVFQHYALFSHMTVFENVAFGLRVRPRWDRPSKAAIKERVQKVLAMVHLDWAGHRMPDQLSGGQRQRVALARALAIEPEVLLLDEPFGALDAQVRAELRQWLRRLHEQTGLTSVFVTHDQEEAMEVADRIVVLHEGRIEQDGTPQEVYDHPATSFIYQFIGQVNRFRGRIRDGHFQVGDASVSVAGHPHEEGTRVEGYLRPHDLDLALERSPGALPATITRIQSTGPLARVRLAAAHDQSDLEAHLSTEDLAQLSLAVGQKIFVKPRRLDLFPDTSPATAEDWVI
ncbi:MAG: sulfate/molybdate ABC transporter ATP-binding protein [Acidobacteria bacterium]|nr:sulfate/molybdate ABC transporter ATP-binding protein [Acidobacteriota bacterium]MBI3488840.1 sulfate/molybdate ABC transporter ATP-binding protein [Acidobacteriota bacterium]